jgi:ankyrin repeat protein
MVKMLLEHRVQSAVCVLDGLCRTPLHWISANRGKSAIPTMISVLLLERGASPGHRDFAGQLPLHIAASNDSSDAGELVRRLVKVLVVTVLISYTMSAQRERCLFFFVFAVWF